MTLGRLTYSRSWWNRTLGNCFTRDERVVQQLQEAGDYNPKLSRDVKFICNSWGVPLPFLPVMRRVKYRLFSQLMLNDKQKFDGNRMSHLWIAHVNGQGIFPKLPVQSKQNHRHWERNRRIKDAMERAKSEIELMNSYLAKKVPMEFKDGSNTVEGAFAETDEEVELVDGEPGIGLGRELQHDDITPPAQQGNVVGNVNRVHFNPQAIMLKHQMAMFASYMRRHLQAPYFPVAMPIPLPVNGKRPADALPIEVAGETIAAMTGFIPGLHREKKRTRGKGKGPKKAPVCGFCRDSTDPEVHNSAKDCPGRWPGGKCPRK
ncbi:hypothetical protein IV203_029432 [Nitzschia inconspicua]|uniref:Uncharacterized protein n=1 Tax=Nitzschia inconspicua TaxID=303405 RepID=A0A9K3Q0E8_9STRA|nr:hypothetical protein IV203_029432 [Nitzschia inconspicua]